MNNLPPELIYMIGAYWNTQEERELPIQFKKENYFENDVIVLRDLDNDICMGIKKGKVYANSFHATSDGRLKENVQDIQDSLNIVNMIEPVTYQWKKSYSEDTTTHPGFIAQQLESIGLNDIVDERGLNKSYKSVNYTEIIPYLVGAIKELSSKVEELEDKLDNIFT